MNNVLIIILTDLSIGYWAQYIKKKSPLTSNNSTYEIHIHIAYGSYLSVDYCLRTKIEIKAIIHQGR